MRVGHKYIAPLFDPAQSSCAICCHPSKVEEIREEFNRWVWKGTALPLILTIKRYCCAHHNVMLYQTFVITPLQKSLHSFRSSSVRQAMTEIFSISEDDLHGHVQVWNSFTTFIVFRYCPRRFTVTWISSAQAFKVVLVNCKGNLTKYSRWEGRLGGNLEAELYCNFFIVVWKPIKRCGQPKLWTFDKSNMVKVHSLSVHKIINRLRVFFCFFVTSVSASPLVR